MSGQLNNLVLDLRVGMPMAAPAWGDLSGRDSRAQRYGLSQPAYWHPDRPMFST